MAKPTKRPTKTQRAMSANTVQLPARVWRDGHHCREARREGCASSPPGDALAYLRRRDLCSSASSWADSPDPQLVESVRSHGTIEPVVVVQRGDRYVLISGHSRVEALRMLGLATVLARVIEVAPEDEAELIIEANRSREKAASQRLREAQALEPIYARRARERQVAGVGRTSDLLAAAVGLGSGKTLERLQEIARQRPELLEAVDAGRKSIGGAWAELRRERRRQAHARRTPGRPRASCHAPTCFSEMPASCSRHWPRSASAAS